MLGFKLQASAATILSGVEMVHMMRKRQARYASYSNPSLASSSKFSLPVEIVATLHVHERLIWSSLTVVSPKRCGM